MIVYYDSKTGNVKRFIKSLVDLNSDIVAININDIEYPSERGHLITYTTGSGAVPITTSYFLERYSNLIQSISASGNRNWGSNFAISADKISSQYNIKLLYKFELSGIPKDVVDYNDLLLSL